MDGSPVVREGTKIFVEIILGHPSFPPFPSSSCFFPILASGSSPVRSNICTMTLDISTVEK